MSQSAIDALIAAQAAGGGEEEDEDAKAAAEEAAAEAAVAELAEEVAEEVGEEPAPEPEPEPVAVSDQASTAAAAAPPPAASAAASHKVKTYAATGTSEIDKLKERVAELETKIAELEAKPAPVAEAGPAPEAIEAMEARLHQMAVSVQQLTAALHALTSQSKASLGFAAQHTFDCPECNSHGTVAVPVACTNCGYEDEWGFFPGDPVN